MNAEMTFVLLSVSWAALIALLLISGYRLVVSKQFVDTAESNKKTLGDLKRRVTLLEMAGEGELKFSQELGHKQIKVVEVGDSDLPLSNISTPE